MDDRCHTSSVMKLMCVYIYIYNYSYLFMWPQSVLEDHTLLIIFCLIFLAELRSFEIIPPERVILPRRSASFTIYFKPVRVYYGIIIIVIMSFTIHNLFQTSEGCNNNCHHVIIVSSCHLLLG